MRRIFISGIAGFIGSHLAEAFIKRGDIVIGVDDLSGGDIRNLPTHLSQSRDLLRFFHEDLGNYPAIAEIFQAHRPEVVYHCAANAREGASFYDPYKITRANALISSVVFELAVKYRASKMVFLSSMSTYGKGKVPCPETARRQPVDIYGAMKTASEEMLEMLAGAHGFPYTIIRPHNCVGQRQSMTDKFRNVAAIFMNSIMREEPLYIYGQGHIRAFSYIEDSLPAFVRAADIGVADGEIVNVGGKDPITITTLAQEIIANFPKYPTPEIIYLPPRHGEVEIAYVTWEKSEKLLGYEEKVGWQEGIKRMAVWAQEHGPQEWKPDRLAIPTEGMPLPWKNLHG